MDDEEMNWRGKNNEPPRLRQVPSTWPCSGARRRNERTNTEAERVKRGRTDSVTREPQRTGTQLSHVLNRSGTPVLDALSLLPRDQPLSSAGARPLTERPTVSPRSNPARRKGNG